MFSIGQFAQLAQISVRALHHYDDLDLLRPARVDPSTGYRFYLAEQLQDLNRLLVLKELGFTLDEIGKMAAEELERDELLTMLRQRHADAEAKAGREQERLRRVETRINLLSNNGDLDAAVVVKPLEAVRLASVVQTINSHDDVDYGELLPKMFGQLVDETLRIDIRPPVGPIQAHFPHRPDGYINIVAGVPVADDQIIESELLTVRELPAIDRAATIVHRGHFAEGQRALAALADWLTASGLESAFDHYREVYLQPEGQPETWVAEYQFVLDPAG